MGHRAVEQEVTPGVVHWQARGTVPETPVNDRPTFWQTALASVFGSDELQSYSAVYTWQANQVGHTMLGFFIAALVYRLAVPKATKPWAKWLLALAPVPIP